MSAYALYVIIDTIGENGFKDIQDCVIYFFHGPQIYHHRLATVFGMFLFYTYE